MFFLQISYYGKIQISRLERSLLLLPTFLMGNLLLFWHSLSETPGTPILTVVLPVLMYYVGFSWWSSFDKEYCQLSVFHLRKKKKKVIVSTSSDCVNVWKYSVSHSALDNSWQKENYSFLLNQLFLCCVPAFLAIVGTVPTKLMWVAKVFTTNRKIVLKREQIGGFPD